MSKSKMTEAVAFLKIEDGFAITQKNGTYRQVDLYEREGAIFCKDGSGLLKVYDTGTTSSPKVSVLGINIKGKRWKVGRYGVLEVVKDGAK